jgi:hypothetical protein
VAQTNPGAPSRVGPAIDSQKATELGLCERRAREIDRELNEAFVIADGFAERGPTVAFGQAGLHVKARMQHRRIDEVVDARADVRLFGIGLRPGELADAAVVRTERALRRRWSASRRERRAMGSTRLPRLDRRHYDDNHSTTVLVTHDNGRAS